jgi:hypothetical protein
MKIVIAEQIGGTWMKGHIYTSASLSAGFGDQMVAQYSDDTTYFAHKDHPFDSSATRMADSLRAGLGSARAPSPAAAGGGSNSR